MRRLRHLRRLSAIVAQLLLVQLTFASGAGACPLDGASTSGAAMVDMGAPHGEHHRMPADAPANHAPDSPASHHHASTHCDMACTPTHCGASGACSVPVLLDGGAADRALANVRALTLTGRDALPQSVTTAPEPPPPRA